MEELNGLLEAHDFEGAEELLAGGIGAAPERLQAFFHYQFGRVYSRWNKLTSAVNHLTKAAELAHLQGDELFLIQVTDELRSAKAKQTSQKP
jgi:hypothetical protein